MSGLVPYKKDFLQAAFEGGVLKFGSFELKSKRISPYFFNAGDFHTARLAASISTAFAKTIIDAQQNHNLEFDIIFGPAYKGIPLCSAITIKLGELAPQNLDTISYSFDRKEAKDHGEGGNIVGSSLKGKKVLIVDDVITAGTAKKEAIAKIRKEGGVVAGIVVALDRKEKSPAADGDDSKPGSSAIGELRKEYGIPIFAILTLDDIVEGMKSFASEDDVRRTEEYRQKYRASEKVCSSTKRIPLGYLNLSWTERCSSTPKTPTDCTYACSHGQMTGIFQQHIVGLIGKGCISTHVHDFSESALFSHKLA